jgi:DNA-binding transcriptional regulator/RsmH inhibitor MraZ
VPGYEKTSIFALAGFRYMLGRNSLKVEETKVLLLDARRRLRLPSRFVASAVVGSMEVCLIGMKDYFEIWDKEKWDRQVT